MLLFSNFSVWLKNGPSCNGEFVNGIEKQTMKKRESLWSAFVSGRRTRCLMPEGCANKSQRKFALLNPNEVRRKTPSGYSPPRTEEDTTSSGLVANLPKLMIHFVNIFKWMLRKFFFIEVWPARFGIHAAFVWWKRIMILIMNWRMELELMW